MIYIAPVVEGHGEVAALPVLLHRMLGDGRPLQVNSPIRVKLGSFLRDNDYFRKYISLAAEKAAVHNGLVLVLLDCDDDCPATCGPALLSRAMQVRQGVHYLVVLAKREFESWFLASMPSFSGHFGIAADVETPSNHSLIRDAKGRLSQEMDQPYDPITHQAHFARLLDLGAAQQNDSFFRFMRKLRSIVSTMP